jgi:hypothetical protein
MRFSLATAVLLLALAHGARADGTKRFLDCTLESESFEDCDAQGYVVRLAVFLIPGLILAVLTLLCCPVFFIGRYCCNCCGGRSPSSGFCCGSSKPAVYSSMDIIRPKLFAIMLILLGAAFSIWGIVESGMTVSGLLGFADDVEDTPVRLMNHLQRIEVALTIPTYDALSDTSSTENLFNNSGLSATGTDVKDKMDAALRDNIGAFRGYVQDFSYVMFVIFAIPLGAVAFGAISAMCNVRTCIPMLLVSIMFLMGFVLWTSHGLFSAVGLAAGDLCAEIRGLKDDKLTILKPVIECDDNMFVDFMNNFRSIEAGIAYRACTAINDVCYDNSQSAFQNAQNGRVFQCASALVCQENSMRFGDVVTYLEGDVTIHPSVRSIPGAQANGFTCATVAASECTPFKCADDCTTSAGERSTAAKMSKQLVVTVSSAAQVANALDTLGGEYGSCDAILSLMLVPFDASCQKIAVGTIGIREAAGLGGIVAIMFIFVFTWGSKRFMALPDADPNDDANMQGVVDMRDVSKGDRSTESLPRPRNM